MRKQTAGFAKKIRAFEIKEEEEIIRTAGEGYVVFDIETTGNGADITEIGALRVDGKGAVTETFHRLVAPEGELAPQVIELTGITPFMLRGKPRISKALPQFLKWIGEAVLVGHGLGDSDLVVIAKVLKKLGRPPLTNRFIDTHSLMNRMYPKEQYPDVKYSVQGLCEYFDLPCTDFHRALDDSRAEKMIFETLVDRMKSEK